MIYLKLPRLIKLRKSLKSIPDATYGGKEVVGTISKQITKKSNQMVNLRGAGVRFMRVRGRIVPIRPKKSPSGS